MSQLMIACDQQQDRSHWLPISGFQDCLSGFQAVGSE